MDGEVYHEPTSVMFGRFKIDRSSDVGGEDGVFSGSDAPWDAGGTQRDKLQKVMCRACGWPGRWPAVSPMVHNVDRWTTKNTEGELATKLMDTWYITWTDGRLRIRKVNWPQN